jgi:hypothetical protein
MVANSPFSRGSAGERVGVREFFRGNALYTTSSEFDSRTGTPSRSEEAGQECPAYKIDRLEVLSTIREISVRSHCSESRQGFRNGGTAETLGEFRYDRNCSNDAKQAWGMLAQLNHREIPPFP